MHQFQPGHRCISNRYKVTQFVFFDYSYIRYSIVTNTNSRQYDKRLKNMSLELHRGRIQETFEIVSLKKRRLAFYSFLREKSPRYQSATNYAPSCAKKMTKICLPSTVLARTLETCAIFYKRVFFVSP